MIDNVAPMYQIFYTIGCRGNNGNGKSVCNEISRERHRSRPLNMCLIGGVEASSAPCVLNKTTKYEDNELA
jgi:hypothetical protein